MENLDFVNIIVSKDEILSGNTSGVLNALRSLIASPEAEYATSNRNMLFFLILRLKNKLLTQFKNKY